MEHWRAVLDGKGRVLVATCFNMDLGDRLGIGRRSALPRALTPRSLIASRRELALYAMTH